MGRSMESEVNTVINYNVSKLRGKRTYMIRALIE